MESFRIQEAIFARLGGWDKGQFGGRPVATEKANRTCMLLAVEKFPANYLEQHAILDQRLLENAAFRDFHSARSKLLEAACRNGPPNIVKQRFN